MKTRYLMILGLAAACSDGSTPPSTMVPGPAPEPGLGGRVVELVSENQRPCGYQRTDIYPPILGDAGATQHFRARITYDRRGLAVLDTAVDDNNEFGYSHAIEYNAMGSPSHFVDTYPFTGSMDTWLVYDSFGRLVRLETANFGVDTEVTYEYGSDGNRSRAHRVWGDAVDDRAYRHDAQARLIELTQDNGPDGVIDLISRFAYDEVQRTRAMTMTDPSGRVVETDTAHYDDRDRVILEEYYSIRNPDEAQIYITYTNAYVGDRLVTSSRVVRDVNPDGSEYVYDSLDEWQYEGCR